MEIRDLQSYGFNVDEAMELCVDDEDILREVLETALEEGREKIPLMEDLMKAEDFDRYIIEAHGLKNAARQIGATRLSELAKASELTGKAGNIGDLKDRHEALMQAYNEVLEVLEKLFS